MSVTPSHLSPLGIHGWTPIESPLLACMMLGEPVCLISEPGAAKTYFGEVIARALGDDLRYGYYDSSKTNFEDFIGFPNPESFKAGRAEFIENELTIWDKDVLMIDEISRVSRDTSNKWLEVLGSRMLLGKHLPVVIMLGAMNPVTHHATHLLDQAFADRFMAFLTIPAYATMDVDARQAILGGSTGLDAPSLSFWNNGQRETRGYVQADETFEQGAQALRSVLQSGATTYAQLAQGEQAVQVRAYADSLGTSLATAGHPIEARRLKMIVRYVLAHAAIEIASGREPNYPAIAETTLWTAFPHPYTGEDLSREHLHAAHARSIGAFSSETAFLATDHAKRFKQALKGALSPRALTAALDDLEHDDSLRAAMTAVALTSIAVKGNTALKPQAWSRISKRAAVEPQPVPLNVVSEQALDIVSRTSGKHRIIMAHASYHEQWLDAYVTAEQELDRALDILREVSHAGA